MDAAEFFKSIVNADFESLLRGKLEEFDIFLQEREDAGANYVVVRFLLELEAADGVPRPYYLWAKYPLDLDEDDSLDIFPPDFTDSKSMLEKPEEIADDPFFEIAVTARVGIGEAYDG